MPDIFLNISTTMEKTIDVREKNIGNKQNSTVQGKWD